MQETVLVYTTWPSAGQAESAGRRLVEQKLCACINILPGMVSVYAWEGKIERAEEAVMILKTAKGRSGALMDAIRAAHPYDTPAIIELAISAIDPRYGAWILAESSA
jgi:periplasmic divalent cation tolerance protein